MAPSPHDEPAFAKTLWRGRGMGRGHGERGCRRCRRAHGGAQPFLLKRAASMIDQRCTIQPIQTNQSKAARTKCTSAVNIRPCTNCPRPGIKKLQIAASTLPVEPAPAIVVAVYYNPEEKRCQHQPPR